MASDIVYVNFADDWEGIYIDGQLYHDGHDIPMDVWLRLLSRVSDDETTIQEWSYEDGSDRQLDPEWCEESSCLPQNLSEVKLLDNENGTRVED